MLILSGIKDYYDHCVAFYGLDNHVVYDRTKYVDVKDYEFFTKKVRWNEKFLESKTRWEKNEKGKYKKVTKMVGEFLYFILEVGDTHYIFEVERYKDEKNNLFMNHKLIEVKENVKKIVEDAVIALIPCNYYFNFWEGVHKISNIHKQFIVINPILKDTFIPSYIESSDIYMKIYNWILSTKEKPIIDKRTDVQKLESQGFDKFSSFRHPWK